MTLPEVRGLLNYWRNSPPVHVLVAGAVGFKRPTEALARDEPDPAAEEMITRVPAADFDALMARHGLPVPGNGGHTP
jgi:hypothetical protein